jgi:hypothetical protein
MIGGAVIGGAKGLVKHLVGCLNVARVDECSNRTIAGLKHAVKKTKALGRWVKGKLNQAGNATKTCMKEKGVHGCTWHALKATGRGIGSLFTGIGKWGKKHVNHWVGRNKESNARQALCEQTLESQAQCDEEDATVSENKKAVWSKLTGSVGSSLKAAPKKAWTAVKSWFSGDD